MGTNDGMMHAFAADTGVERWAYIPSMVIPDLWRLADNLYADRHRNYVNGSPITTDICTANCANAYNAATPSTNPVWKTILVGGLNGGGRGYYALDITNPTAPALLWEFTTTAGIGIVKDNDLGYTFGQPVVTRKADGTWVVLVTSGYDNGTDSPFKSAGSFVAQSPAGSGVGYLYVLNAATGAIISKISTGVGSAAAPSGLAKIAGFNAEPGGNRASFVYGGDLLGNLWRFDINDAATTATIGTGSAFKLATLLGPDIRRAAHHHHADPGHRRGQARRLHRHRQVPGSRGPEHDARSRPSTRSRMTMRPPRWSMRAARWCSNS